MNKLTRRQFLGKSSLGIGAAVLASQASFAGSYPAHSGSVTFPVGFQVWYVREMLNKDFGGTLKMMAGLGYQSLEMCSPPGYESSGFGPLMKYSAKEMKQIINDAGLIWESTHYGMDEFRHNLDERIAFALDSGQKQMVLSSFGLEDNASLKDWLKAADELNKMGEKAKKAGLQMGYHNHDGEFNQLEGKLIYDSLLNQFDPEYIKMQFQVAVIRMGFKASSYFNKYPGRFISAHLADWSIAEKAHVPLGKGIVDWKEFFSSCKTGGLKNIFVETDLEICKEAPKYLHSL